MSKENVLGNAIRQARMKKGITQEGLAELIDITPIHLKHIEGGQGNPSITVLFKLAKELDFSIDSIIVDREIAENSENTDVLISDINYLIKKFTTDELQLLLDITKAIKYNRKQK